jgi:hypothetical protein
MATITSSLSFSKAKYEHKKTPKFIRFENKPLNWKIMMFDLLNHLFIGQKTEAKCCQRNGITQITQTARIGNMIWKSEQKIIAN